MTTDSKKENKPIQRFKVIPGGKKDTPPKPHPPRSEALKNLPPEMVAKFDKVVKSLFKTLQSDDEPKMFQCEHCGGFHALDINCDVCKGTTKAQQVFTMDRPDYLFAMAMCKQCLAISIATFRCHGIDPDKADLQEVLAENEKAQRKEATPCVVDAGTILAVSPNDPKPEGLHRDAPQMEAVAEAEMRQGIDPKNNKKCDH